MYEADPLQEVPDVGDRVVEGEALREIHLASGRVLDAGRMVEVEGHLPARRRPAATAPSAHLAEAAPRDGQLVGIEEREQVLSSQTKAHQASGSSSRPCAPHPYPASTEKDVPSGT